MVTIVRPIFRSYAEILCYPYPVVYVVLEWSRTRLCRSRGSEQVLQLLADCGVRAREQFHLVLCECSHKLCIPIEINEYVFSEFDESEK